jgi:hypothetical protein
MRVRRIQRSSIDEGKTTAEQPGTTGEGAGASQPTPLTIDARKRNLATLKQRMLAGRKQPDAQATPVQAGQPQAYAGAAQAPVKKEAQPQAMRIVVRRDITGDEFEVQGSGVNGDWEKQTTFRTADAANDFLKSWGHDVDGVETLVSEWSPKLKRFSPPKRQESTTTGQAEQAQPLSDAKPIATDATPASNTAPFEHSGLKIRTSRVKVGEEVQDRWVVQTPENAEREARGERQIGGDRIVDTRDQAIQAAEQETKAYAERKAFKEQADAEEAAAKAKDEAKKEANRGKSIAQRRVDAILEKPSTVGQGTKREVIETAVRNGRAIVEKMVEDTAAKKRDREAVDRASRAGYMLGLSNENIPVVKAGLEAQARLKADKYQKPEYRMYSDSREDGPFREISKTEYDYAQELKAQQATRETITPADDKNIGVNVDGNQLYERKDGSIYQMQDGKPRFGGFLEPVSASKEAVAPATHADPGQAPEVATPGVVTDSLKKAARNEDTKPSEMRKWLVAEIDKELLQAADRPDYDEAVKRMGEKDAISWYTGNGLLGKNSETGYITFDVPGDGKYKVRNSVRGLLEFRKNVMASQGFKDGGQKRAKPEQNDGVQGGSGGSMTAIANMIEEGDFEAARDYAEAVGIKLEDVRVPRGDMKPAWEKYLKDGTLPAPPDTKPQPAPKTAAQADMEGAVADGFVQEVNPFAEYDAVAKQYGYEVRPDGMIGKDGKFPGPKVSIQKGRLRVESSAGNLLGSYAATPASIGKFLEAFWYAEKSSAPAQQEAKNPARAVADGFVEVQALLGAQQAAPAPAPAPANDLNAMFDDVLAEEVAKDEAKNAKPTNLKQAITQQRAKRAPRTATQAATSAAKNTASALGNAIDGLGALFGGNGKLGSGLSFDEQTYAKAKPLFQAAVANLGEAGRDMKEAMRAVVRMVMDKFGAQAAQNMKPYVVRFIEDTSQENLDTTTGQADTGTAPVAQGAADTSGGLATAGAVDVAGQSESAQSLTDAPSRLRRIEALNTERSAIARQLEAQGQSIGDDPLGKAIQAATSPLATRDADWLLEALTYSEQTNRTDIAQEVKLRLTELADKLEAESVTDSVTPGVATDNPKYETIAANLRARRESKGLTADAIRARLKSQQAGAPDTTRASQSAGNPEADRTETGAGEEGIRRSVAPAAR